MLSACVADLENQDIQVNTDATSNKISNSSEEAIKGTILVRFNPSAESRLAQCATRSGATRTGVEGVDALLDKVGGYAVQPVFVVTEKNRENVYREGMHLWYKLRFDEASDLDALAKGLANVAEVHAVQFSHRVCRVGKPKAVAAPASTPQTMVKIPIGSTLPFNDPYNTYQWGLLNLGAKSQVSNGGFISNLPTVVQGADINVVPAWKLCKGDSSIVVAVMDEGVQYSHEDLSGNMWVNSAEKNGQSGVDDDSNGFVDDIYGYNFVFYGKLNKPISWDNEGDTGHGSHVAGIISAMNNNGIGINGIAGGSGLKDGVRIQSLQIFLGNSGSEDDGTAAAMQYAADNGAHILQCSWGYLSAVAAGYPKNQLGPANDSSYKTGYKVEKDAIDYFIKYAGSENGPIKGGIVIFAAGNEEAALPAYPAAYEPCIAVAAMSPAMRPAYYTNYGPGTDIIAPGGDAFYKYGEILSTVPSKFGDSGLVNYAMMMGTSQACPHVSGVAALGLSYAKKLGKHFTADEFRSMLLASTNDIEPYLTGSISSSAYQVNLNYPSFKGKLGAGYVDAYKMLLQVEGTPYNVLKCGESTQIDLATYFGEGVYNAELSEIVISDEDKEAVGLSDCIYNKGTLELNCSKRGVATIAVSLLVGGGSLSDKTKPFPTKVTKKFVVIVRDNTPANGGWL